MLRLVVLLFWWHGFPPIFVYAAVMPWLEVHFNVFEANFYNLDLNQLFPQPTGRETYWIASFSFLSAIIGFRIGLIRIWDYVQPSIEWLRMSASGLNQFKIIGLLLSLRVFGAVLGAVIPWGSSIRQLVTYFSGIEIALSILFALHFFLTRKRPWLFYTFFLFDLATSFYSYFGDWKGPVITLLFGVATTIRRVSLKQVLVLTPLIAGAAILLFVWQSVKGEYRSFISNNERAQVVRVSQEEALAKFVDLSSEAIRMPEEERQIVFASTFRRIGYLEYFSGAVAKVPEEIPHERGGMLLENLNFILIPRFLNPEKGIKNDRVKVEKYTDYYFGENSFSSFSLGHYCEAYIDWGFGGALLQLFCFGLLGAFLVRQVYRRFEKFHVLLMLGVLFTVLSPWATMQQDFITMGGSVLWNTICHFFIFLPIYTRINKFIIDSE